jgi:hypothetical protein
MVVFVDFVGHSVSWSGLVATLVVVLNCHSGTVIVAQQLRACPHPKSALTGMPACRTLLSLAGGIPCDELT